MSWLVQSFAIPGSSKRQIIERLCKPSQLCPNTFSFMFLFSHKLQPAGLALSQCTGIIHFPMHNKFMWGSSLRKQLSEKHNSLQRKELIVSEQCEQGMRLLYLWEQQDKPNCHLKLYLSQYNEIVHMVCFPHRLWYSIAFLFWKYCFCPWFKVWWFKF